MNRGWTSYLVIFLLLGLLVVLATLQYRWLGQISHAESTRLSNRLADDTGRFTKDFDSEIQKAFFALQVDADVFKANDLRVFKKRLLFVRQEAVVPGLIEDVFYLDGPDSRRLRRFDETEAKLELVEWPAKLKALQALKPSDLESIKTVGDVLVMPLFKEDGDIRQVVVTRKGEIKDEIETEQLISRPVRSGFLIVLLSREVITTKLLPGLVEKYFSKDGGGAFELSVTDRNGDGVFSTHGKSFKKGDSSASFFRLSPNDFFFLTKKSANPIWAEQRRLEKDPDKKVPLAEQFNVKSRVVFSDTFQTKVKKKKKVKAGGVHTIDLVGPHDTDSRVSVFESGDHSDKGQWLLSVRHTAGSLEAFVINTRNRNLAISFGILAVLAAGMVLIVISTNRAKSLARKQLDFVSSVSHEFRTPLAVIYSAGENITDGVISDKEKLASYGELIKREGSKLSKMVEQVLEYAGANSNKRKYEFRECNINSVIMESISECEPLIEASGFEIETNLSNEIPEISLDKNAITAVFQNLIANGIKYSNGSKWLQITSRVVDGSVNVSVEDHGIGIAPGDLSQIFEPFYRAEGVVDEQISGNGLGLSLVREIVGAHGGRIDVKSVLGQGSLFTVKLPLSR